MDTKLILTLFVVIVAYFYIGWRNDDTSINGAVINAWAEIVVLPHKRFLTVLAGINACIDIIVPATVLLEELGAKDEGAADHPELSTLQNLVQTFKHFFQKGAAAERKFTDSHLFRNLTDTALRIQGSQQYIGGNAALIAQNMVTTFQDVQVNFIGPVGPQLRNFLHPRIRIRQASLQETDEHHLIMEYQVGDGWANVTAPIATRFITSYDETNSRMVYVEAYFEELRTVSPDLAILTGFHMLDGLDETFCSARLRLVAEMLASHPTSAPVHVELASIFNAHLIEGIGQLILPKATSLGLNEQELQQVSALLGGPHKLLYDTVASNGATAGTYGIQPELHRVVDILTWLLRTYGRQNGGRLSRVHFHCLTFHVIAVRKDSGWSHTLAAVAAGTAKASKHACDMESLDLDPSRLEIRVPASSRLYSNGPVVTFDPAKPVISFSHDGCEIAVSPVLVCKHPLKTVGLGDAISATGLLYSQFIAASS